MTKKPAAPGKSPVPPPRGKNARPPALRPGTSAAARRLQTKHKTGDRGPQLTWLIGGGLVVFLLLLIAVGYYSQNISPGFETALRVGKHDISLGYYRDRLRADTVENGNSSQQDAAQRESTITDTIEQEQVYLQRAWSLGVTASEQDIAAQIAQIAHVAVKGNTITDPAQYDFEVRGYLQRSGLSLDELRGIARAAALKQKVIDHFKTTLPAQALAIKGAQFTFDSQDAANAAQQELETGTSVADLTAELQADSTKGQATPLDWTFVPFGVLPHPVDVAASQLQPGQVSGIIQVNAPAQGGATQFEMLAVTERDPQRAIDASSQPTLAADQAAVWYNQQRDALGAHSLLDNSKALWAIQHSGLPVAPAATPTPPFSPGNPSAPNGAPAVPGASAPSGGGVGPQPPQPSAPAAPNATP